MSSNRAIYVVAAGALALAGLAALGAPFSSGDRVAVFGPGESDFGADVAARMQLSWNLAHPGEPVDFFDATYRRDTLKDGFRRWTIDVASVRPTHVLSIFGEAPGSAGFAEDLRLFVLKARSEGAKPMVALPAKGADVVRLVAREESVPVVDMSQLLAKGRGDAPAGARAAYDGLVECERTLGVYNDMRFAAGEHGMYLGDNVPDLSPTTEAWGWWLGADSSRSSNTVVRWEALYGHEKEWRSRRDSCRAELREKTK